MKNNIIDHIIRNTGLNQRDLANELEVSSAQISKWKSGDPIPSDRREQLNKIIDFSGTDSEWAVIAKTKDNSQAWVAYMKHKDEATHVIPYELREFMCMMDYPALLKQMYSFGVPIPNSALKINEAKDTSFDSFVSEFFKKYLVLAAWYDHVVFSDINLVDELFMEPHEVRDCLAGVALNNISRDLIIELGTDMDFFDRNMKDHIDETILKLNIMCNQIVLKGLPLVADYFDIVNKTVDEISQEIPVLKIDKKTVKDYMGYGNLMILKELERQSKLLEKIHHKLAEI
ncbi:helix-turn-helix domain-containing protein [Endozoicomonas lisbonensis]|uniref:Transcriptional regulator with XRE-family HTH domain n=1 Tax=Endozoicomonas lisbonensis TaxID=3120522 RepID=A0ABV2SCY9_9GAMM